MDKTHAKVEEAQSTVFEISKLGRELLYAALIPVIHLSEVHPVPFDIHTLKIFWNVFIIFLFNQCNLILKY